MTTPAVIRTGEAFTRRCRRCGLEVTVRRYQVGPGSWDVRWDEDAHEASCGLRCRETEGHFADTHRGEGRCPRCPAVAPKRRAKPNRRRPSASRPR